MQFNIDEHTGVLIKKAARLFERVANINLDQLGVTYAQTIILVRLWNHDGQTQVQLTKSAGLKQPSILRILERMKKDNLVKRVANPKDKRSHYYFLTEKAKKACKKLEDQGATMHALATKKLEPKAIEQLNQHVSVIINNLEEFIITHNL